MADDLNPAVIKLTQDLLGKYVKKPSLTEKLLRKPPFRFLHDVFRVVIKDTGCFVGLYTPEELTFENIKDREDKMHFLQKIIDVVKLTTKASLTVRTSKIVAGHEPEKTNELLQLTGEIIEKKLDWQSAVEKVISGKTPRNESPTKSKHHVNNKAAKESKTKEKVKEKSKEKEIKSKDLKTTKTSSKTIGSSSNKDDKNKRTKEKSSSSTKPTTTRDKVPKGTKEQDKIIKKSSKEATSRSKITKTESQTSNKSTPSPNTLDSKTSIKSTKNDMDCNHEEVQQANENKMEVMVPPINLKQINKESINKDVSLNNELSNRNQELTTLSSGQMELPERNSAGKSEKSSAKIRKSSGLKRTESNGEKLPEKDNINNLESVKTTLQSQEKSEISELEPTTAKQEQLPPPQQKEPTPPISLTNEVKRESTFTRENSKESSSNQSSIIQRPRTSLRPPSARPPSARPGAPRRRDKNVEIILQPNDQIKMSGIQVKLETFGDLDDDGENLVIIENPNANDATAMEEELKLTESEKIMQDDTLEQQGHLVQQILETQKELIQQSDPNSQIKNDKDSANGLVMRQTSARHMNNLRDVIQNLTKSVNPLGKLMDFIPEDIDAMQLEFTMWRDTYTQAANELKRERSLTESATEPMKNQLVQIEANLTEYMEMIDASRVKILQNTEKIIKMLTTS